MLDFLLFTTKPRNGYTLEREGFRLRLVPRGDYEGVDLATEVVNSDGELWPLHREWASIPLRAGNIRALAADYGPLGVEHVRYVRWPPGLDPVPPSLLPDETNVGQVSALLQSEVMAMDGLGLLPTPTAEEEAQIQAALMERNWRNLEDSPEPGPEVLSVEPLSAWIRELRFLRLAVRLWDAAQEGDQELAHRLNLYRVLLRAYYDGTRPRKILIQEARRLKGAPRFTLFDAKLTALLMVNEKLDLSGPQFDLSEPLRVEPPTPFIIKPKNLLGLVYASFALEIAGMSGPYRRCAHCGKAFKLKRANMRYCPGPCRNRANVNRHYSRSKARKTPS
jgi:hypothetical protein